MTTAHTTVFRKAMISVTAMALFSLPFMASAGTTPAEAPSASPFQTERNTELTNDPESVYDYMKKKSHQVCGSSDLLITGGLTLSRKVEECYEGTLTAAVHRLDHPAETELHFE